MAGASRWLLKGCRPVPASCRCRCRPDAGRPPANKKCILCAIDISEPPLQRHQHPNFPRYPGRPCGNIPKKQTSSTLQETSRPAPKHSQHSATLRRYSLQRQFPSIHFCTLQCPEAAACSSTSRPAQISKKHPEPLHRAGAFQITSLHTYSSTQQRHLVAAPCSCTLQPCSGSRPAPKRTTLPQAAPLEWHLGAAPACSTPQRHQAPACRPIAHPPL